MPVTYQYRAAEDFLRIDADYMGDDIANDPLIGPNGLFPIVETDADALRWSQRDAWLGLMQFRGLNNAPPRVKRVGESEFVMNPGYFGEYIDLDESELTRRADPQAPDRPIVADDLITEADEQLIERQNNRLRQMAWDLLLNGTLTVLDRNGAIGYYESITRRTFTASPLWSSPTTAAPLADLRGLPITARGSAADFGGGAELWLNRKTFNYVRANTNAADLGGQKLDNNRNASSLEDFNRIQVANDLPTFRIYEDGYLNDAGTFTNFLPDGKGVLIGRRRNGAAIGQFRMTRNLMAPGMRGAHLKIVRKGFGDDEHSPPTIGVERGFHGGLVVFFGNAVFALNVA